MGNGIRYYDLLPVVNKRIIDNSLGDAFWSVYQHSGNNDFQTTVLATFHPELEGWVLLIVNWIGLGRAMSRLSVSSYVEFHQHTNRTFLDQQSGIATLYLNMVAA
jgi:hypothetical protein